MEGKQYLILLLTFTFFDVCYSQACDSLLRDNGAIVSQGHPEKYPAFFDCTWTIEAEEYDSVNLVFSDFNIEPGEDCQFDYLEITTLNGKRRFCGDKLSDIGDNGKLSSKGRIQLKMASDDSVQLRGFSLNFEVIPGDPPTTTPTPPVAAATTSTSATSCEDKPCQNGGECMQVDATEIYCFCEDGFEGTYCQTNIDDCGSSPCENGGTCVDGINKWSCDCIKGYIGETCGIDYNECRVDPCKNGGSCEDKLDGFNCICVNGWTGWDCDTEIDECEPNPCENYGVCEDHLGYHTCICHPTFTGTNCTIPLNDITTEPSVVMVTTPNPKDENGDQERNELEGPTTPTVEHKLMNHTPPTTSEPLNGPTEEPANTGAAALEAAAEESPTDTSTESQELEESLKETTTENYLNNQTTPDEPFEIPEDPTGSTYNDSSFKPTNETQTNEVKKNELVTTIIATAATLLSIGGIVSSILYYFKSATARKIHAADGLANDETKPPAPHLDEPNRAKNGIFQKSTGQRSPEEHLLDRTSLLSRHRLLCDQYPERRDLRTSLPPNLSLHASPTGWSGQELSNPQFPVHKLNNDITISKKTSTKKDCLRNKKRKKRHKTKFDDSSQPQIIDVFSPKPTLLKSHKLTPIPPRLPPIRGNPCIMEETQERPWNQPISPPAYSNKFPQATAFSLSQNNPSVDLKLPKRKIARRSKAKRSRLKPQTVETPSNIPMPSLSLPKNEPITFLQFSKNRASSEIPQFPNRQLSLPYLSASHYSANRDYDDYATSTSSHASSRFTSTGKETPLSSLDELHKIRNPFISSYRTHVHYNGS